MRQAGIYIKQITGALDYAPVKNLLLFFIIEFRVHARVQSKYVPCWILEEPKPADLRDFCLRVNYLAT